MKTSTNKLSAYTIATNCSDKSDCQAGIDEIREQIRYRESIGKSIPDYYYLRLGSLKNKINSYE